MGSSILRRRLRDKVTTLATTQRANAPAMEMGRRDGRAAGTGVPPTDGATGWLAPDPAFGNASITASRSTWANSGSLVSLRAW